MKTILLFETLVLLLYLVSADKQLSSLSKMFEKDSKKFQKEINSEINSSSSSSSSSSSEEDKEKKKNNSQYDDNSSSEKEYENITSGMMNNGHILSFIIKNENDKTKLPSKFETTTQKILSSQFVLDEYSHHVQSHKLENLLRMAFTNERLISSKEKQSVM